MKRPRPGRAPSRISATERGALEEYVHDQLRVCADGVDADVVSYDADVDAYATSVKAELVKVQAYESFLDALEEEQMLVVDEDARLVFSERFLDAAAQFYIVHTALLPRLEATVTVGDGKALSMVSPQEGDPWPHKLRDRLEDVALAHTADLAAEVVVQLLKIVTHHASEDDDEIVLDGNDSPDESEGSEEEEEEEEEEESEDEESEDEESEGDDDQDRADALEDLQHLKDSV